MWAHEHWNLDTPPDVVTFSKKLQAAGFFHNVELRPNMGYRNFNTWLADPMRAMELQVISQTIQQHNLLENVTITGKYLMQQLAALQTRHSSKITNVRGVGTFCAFDCMDVSVRDKLIQNLRQNGVQVGGSGTRSIRIRPMLIFAPQHAQIFVRILDKVLTQIQTS